MKYKWIVWNDIVHNAYGNELSKELNQAEERGEEVFSVIECRDGRFVLITRKPAPDA